MATLVSSVAGSSPSAAATVHGYHVAFGVLAVLALAAAALVPVLRPHRERAADHAPDLSFVLEEAA
jgi:heme/copper-type cytochrome/quinol oxidase subunit 3